MSVNGMWLDGNWLTIGLTPQLRHNYLSSLAPRSFHPASVACKRLWLVVVQATNIGVRRPGYNGG